MTDLSRRTLIKATGAVGASMSQASAALDEVSAHDHHRSVPPKTLVVAQGPSRTQSMFYLFFNTEEAAFTL